MRYAKRPIKYVSEKFIVYIISLQDIDTNPPSLRGDKIAEAISTSVILNEVKNLYKYLRFLVRRLADSE
ncbi:MAG: hypothetical protein Q8Q17_03445 [bacterium]|nr:hypothetical protein [bacterium]